MEKHPLEINPVNPKGDLIEFIHRMERDGKISRRIHNSIVRSLKDESSYLPKTISEFARMCRGEEILVIRNFGTNSQSIVKKSLRRARKNTSIAKKYGFNPGNSVYEYKPKEPKTRPISTKPLFKETVRGETHVVEIAPVLKIQSDPQKTIKSDAGLRFIVVGGPSKKRSIEYSALQAYIYRLRDLGYSFEKVSKMFMIGVSEDTIRAILKGEIGDTESIKTLYSRMGEFRAASKPITGL